MSRKPTRTHLGDIEAHQRGRDLRQRLAGVIRRLSLLYHGQVRQMLLDLSCNVDLSGPIDETKLPVKPDGFTVKHATVLRYPGASPAVLCGFQVVSMAVLYYWLYRAIEDPQDARSCERYCGWLEEYLTAPKAYAVVEGPHLELYLYRLMGTEGEEPRPPEWLNENDGETV